MNKILLLLALSVSLFGVESLKVGSLLSTLDDYEYETPKGRIMKVPPKTTLVLVAFEKDMGELVNDYLDTKDKFYIQKNKAVFISDISKMPKVITNMFALPKLKDFKHLIYLQYEDNFRKLVPNEKDRVTLLYIENGEITNIAYAKTIKDIKEAIEK